MSLYSLKKYPDPFLRQKSFRVERVDSREKKILSRMAETMYSANGLGLAGPQVGINEQFIVIDVGEGLIKLINPQIIFAEGESKIEEGCLSVPGVLLTVERAQRVLVEGWDEKGNKIQIPGKDLFAHVLQHEVDHLEGILIIDRGEKKEKRKFNPLLAKFEREFEPLFCHTINQK